jgi:cell wall-associated NlpC family hydrolase
MRFHAMRFQAKNIPVFLVLFLAAVSTARAQETQEKQEKRGRASRSHSLRAQDADSRRGSNGSRPLTRDEGLAIVGAALDGRRHKYFPHDCTHVVHRLYERAGFPYEYANSSDLYAGVDNFRRVARPQAGDLAVWRGHAGIVIDPTEHSFFSLLRSGLQVSSYQSPYWKRRGQPRFFRYLKPISNGALASSIQTVP